MCIQLTRTYSCSHRSPEHTHTCIIRCSTPDVTWDDIRDGLQGQPCLEALERREENHATPCPNCTGDSDLVIKTETVVTYDIPVPRGSSLPIGVDGDDDGITSAHDLHAHRLLGAKSFVENDALAAQAYHASLARLLALELSVHSQPPMYNYTSATENKKSRIHVLNVFQATLPELICRLNKYHQLENCNCAATARPYMNNLASQLRRNKALAMLEMYAPLIDPRKTKDSNKKEMLPREFQGLEHAVHQMLSDWKDAVSGDDNDDVAVAGSRGAEFAQIVAPFSLTRKKSGEIYTDYSPVASRKQALQAVLGKEVLQQSQRAYRVALLPNSNTARSVSFLEDIERKQEHEQRQQEVKERANILYIFQNDDKKPVDAYTSTTLAPQHLLPLPAAVHCLEHVIDILSLDVGLSPPRAESILRLFLPILSGHSQRSSAMEYWEESNRNYNEALARGLEGGRVGKRRGYSYYSGAELPFQLIYNGKGKPRHPASYATLYKLTEEWISDWLAEYNHIIQRKTAFLTSSIMVDARIAAAQQQQLTGKQQQHKGKGKGKGKGNCATTFLTCSICLRPLTLPSDEKGGGGNMPTNANACRLRHCKEDHFFDEACLHRYIRETNKLKCPVCEEPILDIA